MKPVSQEVIDAADEQLRAAFLRFSVAGLRWDYLCNVRESTKQIIREELNRRGVGMMQFQSLGRGIREGGPF